MKKETACVHQGTYIDPKTGGVNTPIFTSSAHEYIGRNDQAYPRYFNTLNQDAVIEKVAALEGAEAGVLFGSGMAAVATSMLAFLEPGDHLAVQAEIYGGSYSFVTEHLMPQGYACTLAATTAEAVIEACTDRTKLIYMETPTNPLLSVVDIQKVSEFARAKGIATIIDSTFASPILQNPIALGIDVVLHSGTKYLGGHSDLSCGIVLSSKKHADKIRSKAKLIGGCLNAQDCSLLERSLKTLSLRMERQSSNAMLIAQWLEESEAIAKVFYPGLRSSPYYEIAKSQMSGFGAMLCFELKSLPALTFMERLKVIRPTLSLGGVESIICAPAATSHLYLTQEERDRLGISDKLLRLSVGIEHVDDLIADMEQALGAA